ncbi:hypothetical protein CDD83_3042 [Cordyceps sp. RAO-2017]|nr:hypothetical protein CDD83_3042 [Cordyceps sp. RAO-2017]
MAKEEAVRKATDMLQQLIDCIEQCSSDSDISSWKDLVASIKQDSNNFQHLIGVAGDTGMGKSSLLNALISETADVAPSSQSGACTAAVCCFSELDAGKPAKSLEAKIHFKPKRTVEQELATFFQELNEFENRSLAPGMTDSTTYGEQERLYDQLHTIRDWSGLKENQLREFGQASSTSQITLTCQDKDDLFDFSHPDQSKVMFISENDARKFLLAIKPYVGSSGKAKKPIRWPLVARIEVFVQSDVLRSGIVLVDLPGEMDALEARSQVARSYYNKLDSLMIVTPGDRAFDNKTAIELLRDDQILDMEADGMMRDNNVCVVVTKVDLMDWRNFVETEYSVNEISADFQELFDRLVAQEKELTAMTQKIEDLGGNRAARNASRAELNDLILQSKQLAEERDELDALCRRRCIEARGSDVKITFQKYFDNIRNSIRTKKVAEVSTKLEVFSVSSLAHRNLAKGKPDAAFQDSKSTGIDALKDWIFRGSLPRREQQADKILHRCNVIFDAMEGWAADEQRMPLKLPEQEHARISDIMDIKREIFKKTRLGKRYEQGKMDLAKEGFVGHINTYQRDRSKSRLHWSTYAACIRRHGGVFKSHAKPQRSHFWQGRTYAYFWNPHVLEWMQVYGQQLRDKTKIVEQKVGDIVGRYINGISESESLPQEFRSAFRRSAYKIENLFAEHGSNLKEAMRSHRSNARQIRLLTRDELAERMGAAYAEAMTITGKDRLSRQADVMQKQAKELKETLFRDVSSFFDNKMNKERKALTRKLKEEAKKTVEAVGKVESKLCDDVCSRGKQPKKRTKKTEAGSTSYELKGSVRQEVEAWRLYWDALKSKLPPAEVVREEDIPGSDADEESDGEPEAAPAKPAKPAKQKAAKQKAAKERTPKEKTPKEKTPKEKAPKEKAPKEKKATPRKRAAKGAGEAPKKVAKKTKGDISDGGKSKNPQPEEPAGASAPSGIAASGAGGQEKAAAAAGLADRPEAEGQRNAEEGVGSGIDVDLAALAALRDGDLGSA